MNVLKFLPSPVFFISCLPSPQSLSSFYLFKWTLNNKKSLTQSPILWTIQTRLRRTKKVNSLKMPLSKRGNLKEQRFLPLSNGGLKLRTGKSAGNWTESAFLCELKCKFRQGAYFVADSLSLLFFPLPSMFLAYMLSSLDRGNIGNAKVANMPEGE